MDVTIIVFNKDRVITLTLLDWLLGWQWDWLIYWQVTKTMLEARTKFTTATGIRIIWKIRTKSKYTYESIIPTKSTARTRIPSVFHTRVTTTTLLRLIHHYSKITARARNPFNISHTSQHSSSTNTVTWVQLFHCLALQPHPAEPTSSDVLTVLAASTSVGSAMAMMTAWTKVTKPSAVSSVCLTVHKTSDGFYRVCQWQ